MEEKKIKKKKLTLSISSKKPYNAPNYIQGKKRTSVVIEKRVSRRRNDKRFVNQESNLSKPSPKFTDKPRPKINNEFGSKDISLNRNLKIRKMAEERATKRFKNIKDDEAQKRKNNLSKNKSSLSKR